MAYGFGIQDKLGQLSPDGVNYAMPQMTAGLGGGGGGGGLLGGAAAGAAGGSMAGPIGAGIGAAAGLIGGLFGMQSEAKKRKMEAEQAGVAAQQDAGQKSASTLANGSSNAFQSLMQSYAGLGRR